MTTTTVHPARPGHPSTGVVLRHLEPADSAAVLAVFAGMGDRSRRLRFLVAKPRLTGADVRQLVAVDRRDHVALLATAVDGDRPVGIARFIRDRDHPDLAEVAVDVVDAWHGRGVGRMLLDTLAGRAVEVGVRRLTAFVATDNPAAARLLTSGPGAVSLVCTDRGVAEYAVSLEGAR